MRVLLSFLVGLVGVLGLAVAAAYLDGRRLPVTHTASVSAVLPAAPARVLGLIADVAAGPKWRPQVKAIQLLPDEDGHPHWVEDLGRGRTMEFVAVESGPVGADGRARRVVQIQGKDFGGEWMYELSPGLAADETKLTITEKGSVTSPLYRFLMVRVFGVRRSLEVYLQDLRGALDGGVR